MNDIILEAAKIVAKKEHLGLKYVLAHFTPEQLFWKVKFWREETENNMDSIRESWL